MDSWTVLVILLNLLVGIKLIILKKIWNKK